MILDSNGNKVSIGDIVHVAIGTIWLVANVVDIKEGGTLVAANPTQKGVTPDRLTLQFELQCIDAQPGQRHQAILRLINPEKEIVVPVSRVNA